MEDAKYHALECWGWWCPKCEEFNIEDDDPSSEELITCVECVNAFNPVEE